MSVLFRFILNKLLLFFCVERSTEMITITYPQHIFYLLSENYVKIKNHQGLFISDLFFLCVVASQS